MSVTSVWLVGQIWMDTYKFICPECMQLQAEINQAGDFVCWFCLVLFWSFLEYNTNILRTEYPLEFWEVHPWRTNGCWWLCAGFKMILSLVILSPSLINCNLVLLVENVTKNHDGDNNFLFKILFLPSCGRHYDGRTPGEGNWTGKLEGWQRSYNPWCRKYFLLRIWFECCQRNIQFPGKY